MLPLLNSNFGHHPMTSVLAMTSSYQTTETIGNSCLTMICNALNAFYQGLVDEHGSLLGEEDNCIDDNSAVDIDKLKGNMAQQEVEDKQKKNLQSTLMNIVDLEDQEQKNLMR